MSGVLFFAIIKIVMVNKNELGPFLDPERMRRGMKAIKRTRTRLIECADRPRLVTFDVLTGMVKCSFPVAQPPELGYEEEDPANIGKAEEIPIRHSDETWNPWGDPR